MILLPPEENNDDEEFTTKVFTNDDHSLKLLGELLSNQVSRDIIRLLIEKEMYANELANKLNIQFSLLSHHLKKMEKLGLLSVNEKRIIKKGELHKYYKINPGIFILLNHTKDETKQKGTLQKIFKESIKFASIGIAAFVSWILAKNNVFKDDNMWSAPFTTDNSITISLIIIIIGLSVVYFLEKKKKV